MFKYFKLEDFDCQETGVNGINVKLVSKLDELRKPAGFLLSLLLVIEILVTALRLRSLNLELTLKVLRQI